MAGWLDNLRKRGVFRVAAGYLAFWWLVVQLLETLAEIFELPAAAIRSIVILLGIGFLPAVAVAWFFDLTPDGLRRSKNVDTSAEGIVRTRRWIDRVIVLLLVLAVGYFAVDKFVFSPGRETLPSAQESIQDAEPVQAPAKSIAVLPFADMSRDGDQAYFSDGLAEELLNLLARVQGLRVASRTSSFTFKNSSEPIEEIARQLRVANVLEGSVRMEGNRVRITAQLIDASTGYHLWSNTYDREMDDVFDVQDDVAEQVTAALQIRIDGDAVKSPAVEVSTYALYLRARQQLVLHGVENLERAETLYRQVLELDPQYTPAWLGLSSVYINQANNNSIPSDEAFSRAREAVTRALEIDPQAEYGYAQLAWIAHYHDKSLRDAAGMYTRALELAPYNAGNIGNAAVLVEGLGRLDIAIRMKEYVVSAHPVDAIPRNNLGLAYYYARRYEEALESLETTLKISPDYIGARFRIGEVYMQLGDAEAALAQYTAEPDEEYRTRGSAVALHALGRKDESDEAMQTLIERWGERWPTDIALAHAGRSEIDEAFEWLDRRFEIGGPGGWETNRLEPALDILKDDPRWERFLERIGASDRYLASIPFDFEVPELLSNAR